MKDQQYLKLLCNTVRDWAENQPFVVRAWVYGSRVQGTHKPNSDLDVAVELCKRPQDKNIYTTWYSHQDALADSLQEEIQPIRLHLEWYGTREETPTIAEGVEETGLLIYDRSEST